MNPYSAGPQDTINWLFFGVSVNIMAAGPILGVVGAARSRMSNSQNRGPMEPTLLTPTAMNNAAFILLFAMPTLQLVLYGLITGF